MKLLYEFEKEIYIPCVLMVLVAIAFLMGAYVAYVSNERKFSRILGCIFSIFVGAGLCVGSVILAINTNEKQNKYQDMVEHKTYKEVTGYVENFTPRDTKNKIEEYFSVNDVWFELGDGMTDLGYTNAADNGGCINHDGMYVTIGYEEAQGKNGRNVILKIEEDDSKSYMKEKPYEYNRALGVVRKILAGIMAFYIYCLIIYVFLVNIRIRRSYKRFSRYIKLRLDEYEIPVCINKLYDRRKFTLTKYSYFIFVFFVLIFIGTGIADKDWSVIILTLAIDIGGTIFFVKKILEDKNNFISEHAILGDGQIKSFDRRYKIVSNNQIKKLLLTNYNMTNDNEVSSITAATGEFYNNKEYVFYPVNKEDTGKFINIIELMKEEENSYK